jgi:hypothetical protein
MANTYVIKRTRVVRVIETLRTRADSEEDAMYLLQEGECEHDDYEILDELVSGEVSEGEVIVDIEEIKDDY